MFLELCSAGRTHYAWGGPFVACIPCCGEANCLVLPLSESWFMANGRLLLLVGGFCRGWRALAAFWDREDGYAAVAGWVHGADSEDYIVL